MRIHAIVLHHMIDDIRDEPHVIARAARNIAAADQRHAGNVPEIAAIRSRLTDAAVGENHGEALRRSGGAQTGVLVECRAGPATGVQSDHQRHALARDERRRQDEIDVLLLSSRHHCDVIQPRAHARAVAVCSCCRLKQ